MHPEPVVPQSREQTPSIGRRLACLPYEILLLIALLLIALFPVAGLNGLALKGLPRAFLQLYLTLIIGGYFLWFWLHGGQTLPMKTWHVRLVDVSGQPLTPARAFSRFLIAALFFGPAGVGLAILFFPGRVSLAIAVWAFFPMIATILWARFDADNQFLHDRIAGTRIVAATKPT